MVVCHDIPAGINEEKRSQGLYSHDRNDCTVEQNHYRFTNWDNIDIFIYFGHYTVTIPPPSWIDIAHKHGVKMLATLIFEQWDDTKAVGKEAKVMLDGKVVARLDFEDKKDAKDGNKFYALKLVEIAKHFGFEGYLINFEVVIEDTAVLIEWLAFLRQKLHEEVKGAELMWYDSVLHTDGTLKWQSALNEKNYKFFEVCDSFFTDYHWGLDNLKVT